ncbi:MAG: class I adenylate-forming enzyme family protein [Hyphomicrobiaceae bacterium]
MFDPKQQEYNLWIGKVPPSRQETHYGNRLVRCFADRPKNSFDLLQNAVAQNPDGEAVVCGRERMTYREMDDAVALCATALRERGVGRGDRVAMQLRNAVVFPVLLFAILRIGAIAVPINAREQAPGVNYITAQSGTRLLICEADLERRATEPIGAASNPEVVAIDSAKPNAYRLSLLRAKSADAPPAQVAEEDTAIILYTSGTTGRPKGAMLTHLSICHSALHYESCMGLSSTDRAVAAVPLSHVTGIVALIMAVARAAATLVVLPEFKPSSFLKLAQQEHMTYSLMVPAMYNLCLLDPQFDGLSYPNWRIAAYGGAAMPPATIAAFAEKLPNVNLMNAYGATETTSPVTLMPPSQTTKRSSSVGRPVPCGDVLAMDDNGREVPAGAAGELWLGGPMVVPGYWEDDDATARSFVGGYWRSGDIGSIDADGYVYVLDRRKDMINRGGYKIYSIEIENVLMTLPGVIEAAVIAKSCPVLGERVHAFVVTNTQIDPDDLRRRCAELVADYKIPETFNFQNNPLPRNANGKILKRELTAA